MTGNRQQHETRDYFNTHAMEWSNKARGQAPDSVNVVKQRNDHVLHVIDERPVTQMVLDVGCGTGGLILDLARRGVRAVGVDFAPEMIQVATKICGEEGLTSAEFHCMSIFDFDLSVPIYDCISANGFIEYISYEQLLEFIGMAHRGLKSGGSLVVGSRNRLFNLFSLNDFTNDEIEAGNTLQLLRESMAIVRAATPSELMSLEPAPLPREGIKQVNTGINVSVRLQYTPVQLMKLLHRSGFEVMDIYPVHVHGVVPQFKDLFPQVHAEVSSHLQTYALGNRQLVPQSSSFMVHARKG